MLLLVGTQAVFAQQRILDIRFAGQKRSQAEYLRRFLGSQVGEAVDSAQVAADCQALRNLMIFRSVSDTLLPVREGVVLRFDLEELITTIPYVDFGGVSGNRYMQVGVIDYHWLGKGVHIGGYYRYDGRHSFQVYQTWPYLNQSPWGISGSVLRFATREPLYFDGMQVDYDYRNLTLEMLGRYEWRFRHYVQWGGAMLFEAFDRLDEGPNSRFPGYIPDEDELLKWIVKGIHVIDRRNYVNHFVTGWSNHFLIETVLNPRDNLDAFWKILNETRGLLKVGGKGNLGIRMRLGLSPDNGSPFVPFVQDSYLNIRGSGNRVARGSKEGVLNTEYRHTLWLQDRQFAVQAVAFADGGWWEYTRGQPMSQEPLVLFYGIGGRIHIFRAYNLILRLDYGRNAMDPKQSGWVLGVGQYF